MKKEVFEAGQKTEIFCSVCDTEQSHTVERVTKNGKITKTVCDVCETVSTFSRGVKTSVSMPEDTQAPLYDQAHKYCKGEAMMHETFGQGEVTGVIDSQKIDVLFGDQVKRLIHGQD